MPLASAAPPLALRAASHDRREGGAWTPWQAAKNHILYVAVRALLLVLRPLPASWLRALGACLGRALYRVGGSPRRVALANLERAYPGLSLVERRALAWRAYAQLGSYLGDTVAQLLGPARFVPLSFEEGSRQVLEDAVARGAGVIFVSAHLGPWERVAGSLVRHGFPLTTLARESYDPRFIRLYDRLRASVGVRSVYRGGASAALAVVRTLRRGGVLGVPMDLRSRVPSVQVPFLGVLAPTPVGPARIALRTGASVVVGTAVPVRRGAQGMPSVRPAEPDLVLRVTRIETTDLLADPAGEQQLTRRLNDAISSRIRDFPEGWVWMHPRFEPTPAENSAPSSRQNRYTSAQTAGEVRRGTGLA
jgi:KDO2-lipid IV(A) lauroyltransferase